MIKESYYFFVSSGLPQPLVCAGYPTIIYFTPTPSCINLFYDASKRHFIFPYAAATTCRLLTRPRIAHTVNEYQMITASIALLRRRNHLKPYFARRPRWKWAGINVTEFEGSYRGQYTRNWDLCCGTVYSSPSVDYPWRDILHVLP